MLDNICTECYYINVQSTNKEEKNMELQDKLKELANFLYEDVVSMRNGDNDAKERIGAEVMSVNSIANVIKTLKEE